MYVVIDWTIFCARAGRYIPSELVSGQLSTVSIGGRELNLRSEKYIKYIIENSSCSHRKYYNG